MRLGPSALRINAGRYTRGRSEGRILCTPCTHPHRFRSVSIPRCSTPDSGRAIQGLPGTHQISNAQRKSRCSLFCGRLRHRRGCKPACPALQLSTGRTPHLRDQVGQRRRDSKLSVVVVTITWSRHSRRIEPITRSTYGFCQGDRGAVTTSVMLIASTRQRRSEPYDASRSRSKYRGAVSLGNASVIWRESQPAVGCYMTFRCRIFRRASAVANQLGS